MRSHLLRKGLFLMLTGMVTLVMGASSSYLSMVQLITTPQKYDQQRVRVVGFLHVGFESSALYLSESDGKHSVTKNALWIDSAEVDVYRGMHKKYVLLEGVFDAAHHGHLQLYSGRLHVERIIPWGDHQ